MVSVLRGCLGLLSRRDKRLLLVAVAAQALTSLMDLAGVLLVGVLASVSVALTTGSELPSSVAEVLQVLHLSNLEPERGLTILAFAALALLLAKSASSLYLTHRIFRFLARRQAAVTARLAREVLQSPLLSLQQRTSQETSYALTLGVQSAVLVVVGQSAVAMADLILLVVLGAGLFLVDPLVTVGASVFLGAAAAILYRLMGSWASRLGRRGADIDIVSTECVQEAVAGYRELWVAGRRRNYADRLELLTWRKAEVASNLQLVGLIPKTVFESALLIGAVALAVSQLLTEDLSAAVGIIVLFLTAGTRIVPAILRLQTAALSVRSAGGTAERTLAIARELDLATTHDANVLGASVSSGSQLGSPSKAPRPAPDVRVEGVSFSYPLAAMPALEGITLEVGSGQSAALVGVTGSGKSTLADVLLGVIKPDEGTVSVGGLTPEEFIRAWPGQVAYVPQLITLGNGTVRSNVGFGLPEDDIDDDLAWEALERAHLAEYLRLSGRGLDTPVGERGFKFSGGQRQRLGIARALYTRPRLVVLDEATSALDAETEDSITRTLSELEGSVTTITVAHRLATIRNCDLVVYLEAGKTVAQGTFAEVRKQSSRFDEQARLLGVS